MKIAPIPRSDLVRLYHREGLSTYAIASRYHCDPKTIYRYLVLENIRTRARKRILLTKNDLVRLYIKNKKSLRALGDQYGYSPAGILKKLREHKISTRSYSEAGTKHQKRDFQGTLADKAYLIGFRIGDLGVRKMRQLIYISCGTTKSEQADLIQNLFSGYGPVWIGKKGKYGSFNVSSSLNGSFSFLLPKHRRVPMWIMGNHALFLSFLAGYTDAEGNFSVVNDTARFRIRSCDKGILQDLYKGLSRFGVAPLWGLDRRRYTGNNRQRLSKDCWGVAVNKRDDLHRILPALIPLLRHQRRIADAVLALQNVKQRRARKVYE